MPGPKRRRAASATARYQLLPAGAQVFAAKFGEDHGRGKLKSSAAPQPRKLRRSLLQGRLGASQAALPKIAGAPGIGAKSLGRGVWRCLRAGMASGREARPVSLPFSVGQEARRLPLGRLGQPSGGAGNAEDRGDGELPARQPKAGNGRPTGFARSKRIPGPSAATAGADVGPQARLSGTGLSTGARQLRSLCSPEQVSRQRRHAASLAGSIPGATQPREPWRSATEAIDHAGSRPEVRREQRKREGRGSRGNRRGPGWRDGGCSGSRTIRAWSRVAAPRPGWQAEDCAGAAGGRWRDEATMRR